MRMSHALYLLERGRIEEGIRQLELQAQSPLGLGEALPARELLAKIALANGRLDQARQLLAPYRQGDEVTMFYDPLIAKLIASGANREEAIARMCALLDACEVDGITSNLTFLRNTLAHPAFAKGDITTDFIALHNEALIQNC